MWKKYRNMAYMGIVGAVLFGVGDWLIYLYPGLKLENNIQPLWAEIPAYRFMGSAWCGIIGGIVMVLFIRPVAEFGLRFGPWEIFSLVFFSLTLIATLGGKSFFNGKNRHLLSFLHFHANIKRILTPSVFP